jgi:hypothetical protein
MEPESQNNPAEPELTPKQEAAIAALISHSTLKKAAAAVGVTEVTLWRWQKQPHFHKAYMLARWKTVQQAMAHIQSSTSKAAAFLDRVIDDDKQDPRLRMTATRLILDNALAAVQLEHQEQRLSEVEEALRKFKEEEAAANRRW